MNKEIRSKRKKKKIDIEEETEAVANNKAVRSKRKKKMNRSLSHLFAGRSAIKKMNMEETEAVASNKAVRSKRKMKKKKKMNKEETDAVAVRTSSNQVRNYLNHDIIIFILSKLPLKSFKRFECVCKSWSTLFQDSYFNTIYINNLTSNNGNHYDHTYIVQGKQFFLLPGQRFEDRIKVDWPAPYQDMYTCPCNISILGGVSLNGILCLNQKPKRQLIFWNPTTGEFKVIPYCVCEYLPPNREPHHALHGFDYDPVTKDYKVIQYVDSDLQDCDDEFVYEDSSSYETFWMIYSLRSNSWRKLDLNIPNRYFFMPDQEMGVYTNGVCHWWARTDDSPNFEDGEEYLLSFDFSNEVMFTTLRPSYLDITKCGFFKRHLVLLNKSFALISTNWEMATIQISILGELGVRESWTTLLTVTCLPSIEYTFGVGNLSNRVLCKKKNKKLAWIDLNTKMIKELDVSVANCFCVGKYKKSFLPMGGLV
jgi:F-box interacting protein